MKLLSLKKLRCKTNCYTFFYLTTCITRNMPTVLSPCKRENGFSLSVMPYTRGRHTDMYSTNIVYNSLIYNPMYRLG